MRNGKSNMWSRSKSVDDAFFVDARKHCRKRLDRPRSAVKKRSFLKEHSSTFNIEQKLFVPLKSDVQVVIAHQIQLVSGWLILVEEFHLLGLRNLESVPDLVMKLLVRNIARYSNSDQVAVVIHLNLHR